MKAQRWSVSLFAMAVVAALFAWNMARPAQPAQAFDMTNERPSPMLGIARGQTVRLNVVNVSTGTPADVTLVFYNRMGAVVARDAETIKPGQAIYLDLNYAAIGDPNLRAAARAVVIGNPNISVASLEVFDDVTGRTSLIISEPWIAR